MVGASVSRNSNTPDSNCYFEVDSENFLVNTSKDAQPNTATLMHSFSLDEQSNRLQEAFFPRQNSSEIEESKARSPLDSDESLKDANFDILKRDNVVETFSLISPAAKMTDASFATPVNHQSVTTSFEPAGTGFQLPKYNPDVNYFDLYWNMYLKNESLMSRVFNESSERDKHLKNILQIEQFYNDP